jgi:chromatin remodeling complex protein RSC6
MTNIIRKSSVKKSKKVKEPVVKVEEPVVKVEEPVEEPVDEESLTDRVNKLTLLVSETSKEIHEKLKVFKIVERDLKRVSIMLKKELKKKNRKQRKTGEASKHGFNAEVRISDELADFLNMERGSKLRRPKVTSLISAYANSRDLKDKNNRGIFRPDTALKKIFGPAIHPLKKGNDEKGYNIFNLQIYLKRHFISEKKLVE